MKTILTLLTFVLLAGCGTMKNRASVEFVPVSEFSSTSNGVVVFSTGAPDHCISTATFVQVFDKNTKKSVAGVPAVSVDVYVMKSEFSDHHGAVNALTLPAGQYYMSPVIANPYVTAVKTPAFGFDVVAGETTYLGELFMTRSCALNTRFVVRDEYVRDMRLASEKNSAFSKISPVKRLLQSLQN